MVEVTDKKQIAVHYFKSWFSVDLLSIAPFDLILTMSSSGGNSNSADFNMLVRVSRISKIYKLIRLMRLVKIFKVLKNKDNLSA